MRQTIMIIEDDPHIVSLLAYVFEDEGYSVLSSATAEEGWDLICTQQVDLVILDINLPGIDGLQLCNRIKEHMVLPVIMLSSRDKDDDVISGLELGADDYIKKPFNHREVLLRAGNLLKRAPERDETLLVTTGDLMIDLTKERVSRSGTVLELTPIEFSILRTLAESLDRIVSWQVICSEVWGSRDWEGGHELVKVNIRRLRKKIELDPSEPVYIMNAWGRGYRLLKLEYADSL
ncbi:MAG: response regulator transcription factor [Spirochaetia bacterium]|nr:response regulator transcription factor [Spirochaetia bacterium]MCF7939980.1 response regulator transcription factor [Spirochaetia bacterium]